MVRPNNFLGAWVNSQNLGSVLLCVCYASIRSSLVIERINVAVSIVLCTHVKQSCSIPKILSGYHTVLLTLDRNIRNWCLIVNHIAGHAMGCRGLYKMTSPHQFISDNVKNIPWCVSKKWSFSEDSMPWRYMLASFCQL